MSKIYFIAFQLNNSEYELLLHYIIIKEAIICNHNQLEDTKFIRIIYIDYGVSIGSL